MYQTLFLLASQGVFNYTKTGKLINTYQKVIIDVSVTYGSKDHLVFLIPALMIFLIYNIIPPLMLTLYPHKAFKLCLSKCRLNSFALRIFVDKLQGCYRDGLGEGRDMRSLSSLYFFLRMAIYLTAYIFRKIQSSHQSFDWVWISAGTAFLIMAFIIVLIKPYKEVHMNYLDTFLLSNLALMHYLIAARIPYMLHVARVLLLSPIAGLLLITFYNKFGIKSACLRLKKALNIKPKQLSNDTTTQALTSEEEKQPLLQPVSNNFYS